MKPTTRPNLRVVRSLPNPLHFESPRDYVDAFLERGGDESDIDRAVDDFERCDAARTRHRRLLRLGGIVTAHDAESIALRRYDRSIGVELVRTWSRDAEAPRILVMLGPPDAGKTFAALVWLAELGAYYVTERELCRLSRASWGDEADRYVKLLRCERLILDEVDPNRVDRDLALRALFDVVDGRKGGSHRTIIIANATPEQFIEHRADPKLQSRLRAYARVEVVVDEPRRGDRGEL